MYPIDGQNYSVQQGLVLPRRPLPVRAVEASAPRASQSQRLPQAQHERETGPRVERFVRGGLDDGGLDLRSRQALAAYQSLSRAGERDELSLLIGIDAYA